MMSAYFSAPALDPNAPKPEGSTITPTVGEQLIVSFSLVFQIQFHRKFVLCAFATCQLPVSSIGS
jgi:hypothetical protein